MNMSEKFKRGGVDLVSLDEHQDELEPPYCSHGPTLMFERFYASGRKSQRFFACAVYRSRKICNFYHPTNEPLTEEKREKYHLTYSRYQLELTSQCTPEVVKRLMLMKRNERCLCEDCGLFVMDKDKENVHAGHRIRHTLTDNELMNPTLILRPESDNHGQAQYFFSNETESLLMSEISRLKITHVICLGVPRLHEAVLNSGTASSFLLDIDHRFSQFYSEKVFQRFNMFNGFFYCEKGSQRLKEFLTSSCSTDNVLLVADPPFGGLLTALKTGMSAIWKIAGRELFTIVVFPYFNEGHMKESFPSLHMLDYQVTYKDHLHFSETRRKARPSPVRIFTNLPLPGLILPKEDGYRFCPPCNRYVHRNNAHCEKCESCTSKDGRPYWHCEKCSVCVKQSYTHCDTCRMCLLPSHNCGKRPSPEGCHVCGEVDHKRKDCPLKTEPRQSISRRDKIKKRKRGFGVDQSLKDLKRPPKIRKKG